MDLRIYGFSTLQNHNPKELNMTKSPFVNLAIERIEKIFTDGGVPEAVLDNVKAECVNQLNKLYIIDSNDHAATVGTIEFEHGLYNVI